jgi:beta-glucosidase
VAKSLVLLKNKRRADQAFGAHSGGGARDGIAQASGGWTITWQGGGDLTNADFPGATSIYGGIAKAAAKTTLSPDGSYAARPDVAIVVFGEEPYAEFVGDRPDHALHDEEGLTLLRKFKAAHIPTVAVLLSGRPLWVNRELEAADAFVAAWLPGSEGAGVADVLIGGGKDFRGGWPSIGPPPAMTAPSPCSASTMAAAIAGPPRLPVLGQACAALNASASGTFELFHKRLAAGVEASIREGADETLLHGFVGKGKQLSVLGFDYSAQEDARELIWKGPADLRLSWPADRMKPLPPPPRARSWCAIPSTRRPGCRYAERRGRGRVDLVPTLAAAAGRGWQSAHIRWLPWRQRGFGVDLAAAGRWA